MQGKAHRGSNCYAATQASNRGEKAKSSNPEIYVSGQELASVHQDKRLCKDKNCQSTRCFKKATRCFNIKIPMKPIYGDDKNCQSPRFMQPEKPNNVMWLKQPAVYTRKLQRSGNRCNLPRQKIQVLKRCNLTEGLWNQRRCNLLCSQ